MVYNPWGCKENDTTERLTLTNAHPLAKIPGFVVSQSPFDSPSRARIVLFLTNQYSETLHFIPLE